MPAGIYVLNNSGSILIDDTYSNLSMSSKGTGTAPSTGVNAFRGSQWFNFDAPAGASSFGMQVFDSSGNVVFDALEKYARVVDVIAGPAYGDPNVTATYQSGRTYAAVVSKRSARHEREVRDDPDSPPGWYNYRDRIRTAVAAFSGATVTIAWNSPAWPAEWSPPIQNVPAPPALDNNSRFIIIDVTGY